MYSSPVNHSWGGGYVVCDFDHIYHRDSVHIEIFIILGAKITAAVRLVVNFFLQLQPKVQSTLKKTKNG